MGDNSRPAVTGYPAAATGFPPPHAGRGYPPNAPAGTAYPYGPPQPGYYNPYPDRRATLLRRFLGALIASVVIFGTILFIVWLVLRPRLPNFRVDSLAVSNFNLTTSSSSSLITGKWDVRLTARNPNGKIKLYYDRIDAYVFYKGERISETSVPPFVQGKKDQTAVRATFAAAGAYLDRRAADGINGDRIRGRVSFNVRLEARVRFKSGFWPARRRWLGVYCWDLPVGLSSNSSSASLVGGSRACRVGL